MEEKMKYEVKNVAKFFAGRSIFITGGTGYVGKVFIEKLLRSCPEIDKLYMLIREKKGLTIEERVKKMFSLPLFDKLNEMNPSAYKKIIPIMGDVSKKYLGLDPADRQVIIDNVSIVIHNAANVKFNDSLQHAILNNTRSVRDLCILAESIKKLVVFLHVSSSYAHCNIPVVDEIPYKSELDWRDAIKVAENVDSYLLKILTSKYIGMFPNTYIFSKKLAEDVVNYYSDRLPCVICRPSIICSTIEDPIPGWIDSFNGPVGIFVAICKGIARSAYAYPDIEMDFIPIDFTIKVFILAIYLRGQVTVQKQPTPMIYNVTSYNLKRITMKHMNLIGFKFMESNPVANPLWYPSINITPWFLIFYINFMLFQLLPAVVIDKLLKLIGRKPLLVKIQRKIYISSIYLFYFTSTKWDFLNKKTMQLMDSVSCEDKASFSLDPHIVNQDKAIFSAFLGSYKYLLKQKMDVETNKRTFRRMWYYYIIMKTVWYIFCLWLVLHSLKWIY